MTEDTRMMDALVQPFAVEGVPPTKSLTIDDLKTIKGSLEEFKAALEEHENRQRADGKGQGESGDADNSPHGQAGRHCLVLTGYLGEEYRPPGCDTGKRTEEALIKACERQFDTSSESAESREFRSYYPFEQPAVGEENLPGGSGPRERIDVILESSGGSLDSAFRIALYMRKFARDIRIYVPWRAKSAATLIAIGADQVVMSPYAELGPLDTQIRDPRNPGTFISALDCYQSVDYVRDFGVESISRALRVMLYQTQKAIPLAQLIDSATNFAIGDVKPMLEQVKALDFGGWGRTLKIGETYAKALRRRLRDPDTKEDAEKIADKLVYRYPHHHYPLDIEEVGKLGLTAEKMPKEVYKAAEAIAEVCRGNSHFDDSRFVGFSEDIQDAITGLERENGTTHARNKASAEIRNARGELSPVAVDRIDKDRIDTDDRD